MKLSDILQLAVKLLSMQAEKNPAKTFTKNGKTMSITQVVESLNELRSWLYPDLVTEDVCKVVRCKRCMYYRKFRTKGMKSQEFMACKLDMKKRDPMFFCKDGEER